MWASGQLNDKATSEIWGAKLKRSLWGKGTYEYKKKFGIAPESKIKRWEKRTQQNARKKGSTNQVPRKPVNKQLYCRQVIVRQASLGREREF